MVAYKNEISFVTNNMPSCDQWKCFYYRYLALYMFSAINAHGQEFLQPRKSLKQKCLEIWQKYLPCWYKSFFVKHEVRRFNKKSAVIKSRKRLECRRSLKLENNISILDGNGTHSSVEVQVCMNTIRLMKFEKNMMLQLTWKLAFKLCDERRLILAGHLRAKTSKVFSFPTSPSLTKNYIPSLLYSSLLFYYAKCNQISWIADILWHIELPARSFKISVWIVRRVRSFTIVP